MPFPQCVDYVVVDVPGLTDYKGIHIAKADGVKVSNALLRKDLVGKEGTEFPSSSVALSVM